MRTSHILIVEDSATQAESLSALLEEQGAQVEVAASAELALARLADDGRPLPDLILSDILMPGLSGYELTRRVKDDSRMAHVPVVLLTSLSDPLDIVRGLECGADNYVTKPYDPEYLVARLNHVLGQRRLRRTSRASLGVHLSFLGTTFTINSDREQILDLFISSVEDVVRTNYALQVSQRELAEAQQQLERYARQMAHRAHVSSEKYSALMQSASDAIVVLNGDDEIVEANARAADLFGYELEALRGRPLTALADDGDVAALRQRIHADSGPDVGADGGDFSFVRASGAVITCGVSASHSPGHAGDLRLVILHDVTDRRRKEAEVRRTNELLRAVIEASPPAIIALDRAGLATLWNPAAERMFGWRADEVIGRELPTGPSDGRVGFDLLRDAAAAGGAAFDATQPRRDGTLADVRVSSNGLRDDSGRLDGLVALIEDITDRKRTELALAEREEQLRHAQKMEAIGRLAGGVAHDFNNLLTAIRGYTHLLLGEVSPESPMRADLEEIDKATTRATALTAQLLTFSRKQVRQLRILNLNAVVEGIEKMLRRLITENIVLDTRLAGAPPHVRADAGQLDQVLINLVVNAADAMPGGGSIVIETNSVVLSQPLSDGQTSVPPGAYVTLAVRDSGTGIDPTVRAHIFEPFFTTKPAGKGTGLGLATVFGIVQQTEGYIMVESAPGGTTFTVYLPRLAEAPEARSPSEVDGSEGGGSETVLVVEDDAAVRKIATKSLARAGYSVLEAPDAAAALHLFSTHGPWINLVITDAVMPGMSGPELAAHLTRVRPALPILLMTGYTDRMGDEPGIMHLLNKPFSPTELIRRVREILDEAMGE